MPYDGTHKEGGGGGSGNHRDPEKEHIKKCVLASVMMARLQNVCVDCAMVETGIFLVAQSLAHITPHIIRKCVNDDDLDIKSAEVAVDDLIRDTLQSIITRYEEIMEALIEKKGSKEDDR